MSTRDDADWQRLGRDPYWAVLTDPRFRLATMSQADRDEFFGGGERHAAAVFAACETWRPAPWSPRRALDFGCGVGRLLPALARRCAAVVGADVAPAMLEEAVANCRRLALSNVDLVRVGDAAAELEGEFDFIHSVIVFQHIAPARGERLLAELCGRLAPGGIAALHFTTGARTPDVGGRGDGWREDSRLLRPLANLLAGRPLGEPPMRMYTYDENRLLRIGAEQQCRALDSQPFAVPGHDSVFLYFEKPLPNSRASLPAAL